MKPIGEQVVVIAGASSGFGLLSAKECLQLRILRVQNQRVVNRVEHRLVIRHLVGDVGPVKRRSALPLQRIPVLLTRPAALFVVITMAVAAFIRQAGDPFAERELALVYGTAAGMLLPTGAGRYSIDRRLRGNL